MPEPIHQDAQGEGAAPESRTNGPGTSLEIDVIDLNAQGDGVGRADGLVVFVPGALPGERARVTITRRRRAHAQARLVDLVSRSPARRRPSCRHQAECGGCPLMISDEGAVLRSKVQHLEQTFRRVGGIDLSVDEARPSPSATRYRGRVRFAVEGGARAPRIGYRPRGRPRQLVEIEDCVIGPESAAHVARQFVDALGRSTRDPARPWPREIEVRHSVARHEWLVVVHGSTADWPEARLAAGELLEREPRVAGVVLLARPSRRAATREVVLAGRSTIVETIAGFDVEIGASTFVQVNPGAAERLYRGVADQLGVEPRGRLLDLYCGVGLLGLVASKGGEVVGIESNAASVRAARRAARTARRDGVQVLRGDAAVEAARLAAAGETFGWIAINPPRAGMSARLHETIPLLGPRIVVVVSCHPAALARDVSRLAALGFRPTRVTAVDMFPHTAHLEAVVRLEAGA